MPLKIGNITGNTIQVDTPDITSAIDVDGNRLSLFLSGVVSSIPTNIASIVFGNGVVGIGE